MYVLFQKWVWLFLGEPEEGIAEIFRLGHPKALVPTSRLRPLSPITLATASLRNLEDYPVRHQAEANRRLEVIQPLLISTPSKAVVYDAAKSLGVSVLTLQRYVDRYLFSGKKITSLIPCVFRFNQAHRTLTDEQKEFLHESIRKHHLSLDRFPDSIVVVKIDEDFQAKSLKAPSRSTIIRYIKALPPSLSTQERRGKRVAKEIFERHLGNAPTGDRPLGLIEIDHTLLNIFVVLPSGKRRRPWITVAIDTYTRMVLGFYISFDHPSELSVGLCLHRAMTEKVDWLRSHGITTSWPCFGRPIIVQTDNAREFRGYSLNEIAYNHNLIIQFRPVAEPSWGSHVEALMGTISYAMELLPGKTFASVVKREDYPSEELAVLTIDDLEKCLLHFFVEIYHHSAHRGINNFSPISKWVEYFNHQENSNTPEQMVVYAGEQLLMSLLPSFTRTIQEGGVAWKSLQFRDPVLYKHIRAKNPDRADGLWRFHYDPRDISRLFWKDPDTNRYCAIPITSIGNIGITEWEHQDYREKDISDAKSSTDEQTIKKGREGIKSTISDKKPISLKSIKNTKKGNNKTTSAINNNTTPLAQPYSVASTGSKNPPNTPINWDNIPKFEISLI